MYRWDSRLYISYLLFHKGHNISLPSERDQTLGVLTDGGHAAPEARLADQEEERKCPLDQDGLHLALTVEGAPDHTARVDQLGLRAVRIVVQTEGLLVAGDGGGGGPSPSPSSTPLDQGVREETEQTNCPADVDVVHGQHRPASGGQLGGSEPDLVGQEEDVGGEEDGQSLVGRAPTS